MKMKKLLLAVFLSILFMFSSFVPSISCYASNNASVSDDFMKYNQKVTGFIIDKTTKVINFYKDFFNLHKNDYNGDDKSFDNFINDNIYDDGTDTTMSPDVVNFFRDCTLNYINNETGYKYVYSVNSSKLLSLFNNQDQYHALVNLLSSNQDRMCFFRSINHSVLVSNDDMELVNNGFIGGYYSIFLYYHWGDTAGHFSAYSYNSNTLSYELVNSSASYGSYLDSCIALSDPTMSFYSGHGNIVSLNTKQYIMYNSFDSMRAGSEGVQEYYVTDSFNTSTVNAPITYSNESINNQISYQNVSNYVNSYYVNNQVYPSSQDTYNYINNYNGSGGGSGGGSDDDDDDDGWDWGFLDSIAGFLKGLLKALKTAIEGVLDLLTGIVDLFIGEEQPDGSRSGGLPNIVGMLLEHFLPFLPSEFLNLIKFSLIMALVLGIIRLIRGH